MKRNHLIIISAALAAALAVSGCGSKKGGGQMPSGAAGMQQETSVTVETETAQKENIEETSKFLGTAKAQTTISVVAKNTGLKVTSKNFDVGDTVAEGDVLCVLDTTDAQSNMAMGEASVASAQANVKSAQTNLKNVNGSSTQTQINNAQNSVTTTKMAYETAKSEYDVGSDLYKIGGISEFEYTSLKNTYETAKLNYETAQHDYDVLVNQTIGENKENAENSLQTAQAQLQSAQAQMANYQRTLSDCTITSPISGVVLSCEAQQGEVLTTNIPYVIIDDSVIKIEVGVSQQLAATLKKGDKADIEISSISKEFTGEITKVAPGAESDGTYMIEVEVDNSDRSIKDGMSAEVTFIKNQSSSNIVVDRNAVLENSGEKYVFINKDGKAEKAVVETGIDNGVRIEITSGLTVGDEVVVNGNAYLKEGDTLNIVTGNETAEDAMNMSNTAPKEGDMPQGDMPKGNRPEAKGE